VLNFKNWSIRQKVVNTSLFLTLLMFMLVLALYMHESQKRIVDEYVKKGRSITLAIEGVREEMGKHWELGIFTPANIREWAKAGEMNKVLSTIPVVSAWEAGIRKSREGEYTFRVPKFYPRNPKNEPDELEARALKALEKDNLSEYYEIDIKNNMRYFRPIKLDATCLYCHGDPKNSLQLWGNSNGKDPTGGPMENWKAGEVHGAFQVIQSLEAADRQIIAMAKAAFAVVIIGLFITMLVFRSIISRNVEAPLIQMSEVASRLSQGEVDQTITFESGDEIGNMADSFRKSISYIKEASKVAESLSHGNLDVKVQVISARDVLNNALLRMVMNLRDIITQIQSAAEQVSAGAAEISSSSQSLSTGATEQAASLEEINASMMEISSRSKTNDESSKNANQLAVQAKKAAENGNDEMQIMMTAMHKINESSAQIARIIKVIDDIAFQTSILALNAAVEAAHVGTLGKGFAVVADEVRNLANRSAKAANETTELVENLVREVEKGHQISQKTRETFTSIVESVMKTATLMEEVALASSEQNHGTQEVSAGLAQIETVTQSIAANSEETAASSVDLSSQASQLRDLLQRFQL
jgi:methyl-accepting chemotaxis protein